MSTLDDILKLSQLIPIIATLTGNSKIGPLVQQLINIAVAQLESQANNSGKTTDQILQEASVAWDKALQNAQDLRNMP